MTENMNERTKIDTNEIPDLKAKVVTMLRASFEQCVESYEATTMGAMTYGAIHIMASEP